MVYPQSNLAVEATLLEQTDFNETDRASTEDHAAHAAGKTCAKCGRAIDAGQDARRKGETDWVHDVCPTVVD